MPQGPGAGTLGAEFDNLPAQDLAVQSKALTWLNFVGGTLSGSFRSARAQGKVGTLNASLDFGAGTLSAGPESSPVSYSEAKTYFTYDPKRARLDVSRALIKSDWARSRQRAMHCCSWAGRRSAALAGWS